MCSVVAVALFGIVLWFRAPAVFLSTPSGDMVLVKGGEALFGIERKPVKVASFYIDRTEVTNRAYLRFCRETNHQEPPGAADSPDDPVVNVDFQDAQQFARWVKKRLPTSDEWEKAARGPTGLQYPWGDSLDYDRTNIPADHAAEKTQRLAPASAYPSGASPYGALNMLGNAWEWVDAPAPVPEGDHFTQYEKQFNNLTPSLSPNEAFYQARGGSYRQYVADPSTLIWDYTPMPARARKPDVGFRCARDVRWYDYFMTASR